MAKLGKGWKAEVPLGDEIVTLHLREATNPEINKFKGSRYITKGKRMDDKSNEAREELFDKLCTGIENLESHDDTPITVERIEEVPSNWKHDIIFQKFEDTDIDVKN